MPWTGGVDAPDLAPALGRLQVYKVTDGGDFRLVHEVEGITRRDSSKIKRPVDSVAVWRSGGG